MTDRVELTDAEREALAESGGTTIECRCEFCLNTEAAVESIVAARVAALTAERDELRGKNGVSEWMYNRTLAERDAARAELSAANARISELEAGEAVGCGHPHQWRTFRPYNQPAYQSCAGCGNVIPAPKDDRAAGVGTKDGDDDANRT